MSKFAEVSPRTMTEHLKLVITEVNKMFETDYNMISFDSLPLNELLQVLCNVLQRLDAGSEVEVEKNPEQAIVKILDSLNSIKYSPPEEASPNKFREGITRGERRIITPLLYWLLSNQKQVKKRAYLAKYVDKVEIPPEVFGDSEIASAYAQYSKLIEEFWKVYTTYKKDKKNAYETVELQRDAQKIDYDLTKLEQRIDMQKEKIDKIPNKDTLLVLAKAYRNEWSQQRRLEKQLKEQQVVVKQMENEVKEIRDKLSQKQSRSKINIVDELQDELRINKILAEQKLPGELKLVKEGLEMYESVATEPSPTADELEALKLEEDHIAQEIKKLVEQKMALTNPGDNQLAPFRNQATIIANKKQEVSNTVMETKAMINDLNSDINEKQELLLTLVGGPVLHGDDLKQFVAKLRERSVLYKEYRSQLQGLTTELNVVTRTLEVLKEIDPTIEDFLKKINEAEITSETIPDDIGELKIKCKLLIKDGDKMRAETAQIGEELLSKREEFKAFMANYTKGKEVFDKLTGALSNEVNQLEEEVVVVEARINAGEEKWKLLRREIEKKEETLVLISEEIINSVDDTTKTEITQKEILTKRVHDLEETKKGLQLEVLLLEDQKKEIREQLEMLTGILKLLNFKMSN